MRKLVVFNNVALDGYFAASSGDFSWAKSRADDEFSAFIAENAKGDGELLFGRITYQMMASYWPTDLAKKNDPVVAERMNALPKVVFSRTLQSASWNNTKLLKDNLPEAVRRMKKESGSDLVILGSGSIVSQLAQEGLIDEYQMVMNPVILGSGKTMFEGMKRALPLKLTKTRTFGNGNIFLCYEPAA